MFKHFRVIPLLAAAWFVLPLAASAAPADANAGRILIDVSGHGEAWYVNPQTFMRVHLGRPHEAVERLRDRALQVSAFHIDRLASVPGATTDAAYAKQVSGFVLLANDAPGAAWYVDPATGLRRRLVTPEDAWALMRSGAGASAAVLKAIPIEPSDRYPRPRVETVKIGKVLSADTIELADGAKVRILNVDIPANPDLQQAAIDRITQVIGPSGMVTLERDVDDRLSDFRLLRHVHANGMNIGYELVVNGLAFHDFYDPNYAYAEQYVVAGLDAARLKRGFWNRQP